MNSILRTSGLA